MASRQRFDRKAIPDEFCGAAAGPPVFPAGAAGWELVMKNLAILFPLLATPAQANTLTLICTGKTFQKGEIDMVPGTAALDLDKLTFKPPWTDVTYCIHSVNETEVWFMVESDRSLTARPVD